MICIVLATQLGALYFPVQQILNISIFLAIIFVFLDA